MAGAKPVAGRRGRPLRPIERAQVARRISRGERTPQIRAALGYSRMTVYRIRDEVQLRRRSIAHSKLRLSFAEREQISRGLAAGLSARAIARRLARAPSTISREITRCGGRGRYRALSAERHAAERARRPKPTKLSCCPQLCEQVEAGLLEFWSPHQISARLKADYPEDPEMQISHDTIYQSLYVQNRAR